MVSPPFGRGHHDFNPRSPYGERLSGFISSAVWALFQSTLPLRGATFENFAFVSGAGISIHAPLTGSDHALDFGLFAEILFQSTLPLRGATLGRSISLTRFSISIHAPLTGSDTEPQIRRLKLRISIHAPLTGSDPDPVFIDTEGSNFNPRSPYGERPPSVRPWLPPFPISIHAPLTGSD